MDIEVCKRLNNNKRQFLLLNKDQCKHYPSSPQRAVRMFEELADKIKIPNDKNVLVVGFAETATGVASFVAYFNGWSCICTTRKDIDGEYIAFSEVHSHAVEHKLRKIDFSVYDEIVFIDDEITTGNTVYNLISKLKELYPKAGIKYSVASLLNCMDEKSKSKFSSMDIDLYYLQELDNSSFNEKIQGVSDIGDVDTDSFPVMRSSVSHCDTLRAYPSDVLLSGEDLAGLVGELYSNKAEGIDTFLDVIGGNIVDRLDCTQDFIDEVLEHGRALGITDKPKDVLILGTEECMFPAICCGAYLEEYGYNVKCHSTTLSPIVVSDAQGYPLRTRYKLNSCYNDDKVSYIYNLDKYDAVVFMSDSGSRGWDRCLNELSRILTNLGNKLLLSVDLIPEEDGLHAEFF